MRLTPRLAFAPTLRYADSAEWEAGGRTIQREPRAILGAALPSVAVTIATLLLMTVALSIMLPSLPAGAHGPQWALGWTRGALFLAGVSFFAIAVVSFLRLSATRRMAEAARREPAPVLRPPGYTVVALGGAPDDTRAIADSPDASEAVALVQGWRQAHPEERIIIFAPDGEPLAFLRPVRQAWTGRAAGRGAA